LYIGGIEHAILHLLYARFIYKFLSMTDFLPESKKGPSDADAEPFTKLVTQGMVHGKTYSDPWTGRFLKPVELDVADPSIPKIASTGEVAKVSFEKMSKSKHNGVDPTEFINKYGADATRAHMIFQAPVGDVLNWDDAKISGVTRWLGRLYELIQAFSEPVEHAKVTPKAYLEDCANKVASMDEKQLARWDADSAVWRELEQAIASVTAAYEKVYSLNTVVSDLMTLSNTVIDNDAAHPLIRREAAASIIAMLAPITPAFAEECWSILNPSSATTLFASVSFPVSDGSAAFLQPRLQSVAIQINGKLRGVADIPRPSAKLEGDALQDWIVKELLATDEGKSKFSSGPYDVKLARRTIVARGGKTINFVI
jgi:leucyl-tRNA synthetase